MQSTYSCCNKLLGFHSAVDDELVVEEEDDVFLSNPMPSRQKREGPVMLLSSTKGLAGRSTSAPLALLLEEAEKGQSRSIRARKRSRKT